MESLVTLVGRTTFCLSGRTGDLLPDSTQGLFCAGARILSGWQVRVSGSVPEVVTVLHQAPARAVFVSRVRVGDQRTEVLIERTRWIEEGMQERFRLRNLARHPVRTGLQIRAGADFADRFEVRHGRHRPRGPISAHPRRWGLEFRHEWDGARQGVRITAEQAVAYREGLHFEVALPPAGEWQAEVAVSAHGLIESGAGTECSAGSSADASADSSAESSAGSYLTLHPGGLVHPEVQLVGDPPARAGAQILTRSRHDLAELRITDPEDPEVSTVVAGKPWSMTLFGRDALLAGYLTLPLDHTLALGTLRALARVQGDQVDVRTEEQPGRILQEARAGVRRYGAIDTGPLFVLLLGELERSGAAPEAVRELLPHADRALAWIEQYGDRDGDGFVEYQRMSEHGHRHQGWKDSDTAITFADGRPARPPIAPAEVQGYVHAAYRARVRLARAVGDQATARRFQARADQLRSAFNQQFWLPEQGWFALGLDADKQPIDALASNIGHCLGSGLIEDDKIAAVAERLLSPEMFTGWGVRTLASTMAAYNPMGYHTGAVWPHDTALIASGLVRAGQVAHGRRLATGMLDAAAALGGRLPELFSGFDRADYPTPIPYPTACSPQAGAAAAAVRLVLLMAGSDQ